MPDGPVIRAATHDDAVAVADCHTACWREAYAGLVDDDYLYSALVERRRLARWRDRLGGSRAVWLAEQADQIVGVASADRAQDGGSTAVQLMSIYVRAVHHATGLAGRLLDATIGSGPAFLWVPPIRAPAASTSAMGSPQMGRT